MPDTTNRLRRLLEMEGTLTKAELADRLHLTGRHVRRLVAELDEQGVPIIHGRDGRQRTYSIPEPHRRQRVPVRLPPAALQRLLACVDDAEDAAGLEARRALQDALRAEP